MNDSPKNFFTITKHENNCPLLNVSQEEIHERPRITTILEKFVSYSTVSEILENTDKADVSHGKVVKVITYVFVLFPTLSDACTPGTE